jgi:predicted nucleic acid-binding Zn ribbon protein
MQPLGVVLGRVLEDLGLKRGVLGWRAVEAWSRTVGPRIARHTRAVAYRDGTLQVEVDGSAWMHELGFLKRELIRKINDALGSDEVRDVRFTILRGGNQR